MHRVFFTTVVCCKLVASLPLLDDYHKAREISELYEKPLVVVFVSKENLDLQEILTSKGFAETMGQDCLFVRRETLAAPIVILLDKEGQEISRIGYQGQSAESLSKILREKIEAYQNLLLEYERAEREDRLQVLYEKASDLGAHMMHERILEKGLKQTHGVFFALERYVTLVNRGATQSVEARALREKIVMQGDAESHLRLALLDFQERGETDSLREYIKAWGLPNSEMGQKLSQIMTMSHSWDKKLP